MKKALALLFCVCILAAFSACSAAPAVKPPEPEIPAPREDAPAPEPEPTGADQSPPIEDPEVFYETEPPEPEPPLITTKADETGVFVKLLSQPDQLYGVSFYLPQDWSYTLNRYTRPGVGVEIRPQDQAAHGYLLIRCSDSFGVCGTGLKSEDIVFNGHPASKGTYDNAEVWDYIALTDFRGCAIINEAPDLFAEYGDEIDAILDTVEFIHPPAED